MKRAQPGQRVPLEQPVLLDLKVPMENLGKEVGQANTGKPVQLEQRVLLVQRVQRVLRVLLVQRVKQARPELQERPERPGLLVLLERFWEHRSCTTA